MAQATGSTGYSRSRPRDTRRSGARTSALATVESATHSCGTIAVEAGDSDPEPPASTGGFTLPFVGTVSPRNPRFLAAAGVGALLLLR